MTKFIIILETEKSFEDVMKSVQKMKTKYLNETDKIVSIKEGD